MFSSVSEFHLAAVERRAESVKKFLRQKQECRRPPRADKEAHDMANKLHKVKKIHGEIQDSVSMQLSTLCWEGRDSLTSQQGGCWLHRPDSCHWDLFAGQFCAWRTVCAVGPSASEPSFWGPSSWGLILTPLGLKCIPPPPSSCPQ